MGKASRRKKSQSGQVKVAKAPFVARPFEGIDGEVDLVAAKEFVPAGRGTVTLSVDGQDHEVQLVTLLPMQWPALKRQDGAVLVALQNAAGSGDASRDVAKAALAALEVEPGIPVTGLTPATAETPRLQDLLADGTFRVEVQDTFDYWLAPADRTEEALGRLGEANSAIMPNGRLDGVDGVFWCEIGGRKYLRWVLDHDEDDARDAIARLWTAGEHTLGEDSAMLGAFRACGLLVPVIEIPVGDDAQDWAGRMGELVSRYTTALAAKKPLTSDEKRVREAMSSRQITLR